jgi:hypothetical protein
MIIHGAWGRGAESEDIHKLFSILKKNCYKNHAINLKVIAIFTNAYISTT